MQTLGQDWRVGAAVFESLLVDHDYAVNTVNWAYFAGVGNDPRNRVFRTVSQGLKYDPQAALVHQWVPELAGLVPELAHQPWKLPADGPHAAYIAPLASPQTQVAFELGG